MRKKRCSRGAERIEVRVRRFLETDGDSEVYPKRSTFLIPTPPFEKKRSKTIVNLGRRSETYNHRGELVATCTTPTVDQPLSVEWGKVNSSGSWVIKNLRTGEEWVVLEKTASLMERDLEENPSEFTETEEGIFTRYSPLEDWL